MSEEVVRLTIDFLETKQSKFARTALDYYDGRQLDHVVTLLDTPQQGRKNWRERGMRATYRNITQSIIDKSTMVFLDGRPSIVINDMAGNELDEDTMKLSKLLDTAVFDSFLSNFDAVVRLLKTGLILTQYAREFQQLSFDILHRGNCFVKTEGPRETVTVLCYIIEITTEGKVYRVITPETIEDYLVVDKEFSQRGTTRSQPREIKAINKEPNPYGVVPVSVFYDMKVPREGFWNYIPQDLIRFNEEYNLYLVDTFFAASFANNKALFTNAQIGSDNYYEDEAQVQTIQRWGDKLPRQASSTYNNSSIIGPDSIVEIDTAGVENPIVEYKGPEINLEEINKMFGVLLREIASDWSVRIKTDGNGTANSGFQVVVEEMDNLELRKQRQSNFILGLVDLFLTIRLVVNTAEGQLVFNEEGFPNIEFGAPSLPFEEDKQDAIWFERIDNGVASRVDYLMFKHNISRSEAEQRLQAIDEDNEDFALVNEDDLPE